MTELIEALRNCADYSDCGICKLNGKSNCADIVMRDAADAIERLMAQVPAWISVEERLPEAHRPVWTAIYTTDLIFVQDGETIEEAAERTQAEAEKHPRCEMGAVDEGGFWYELTFGAPMVCRPSFWMEPPKAPDLT